MTREHFLSLRYLQQGSLTQQEGYKVIQQSAVFEHLKKYNPVLTGTLPLDLFITGSDLDICCEVYQPDPFESDLRYHFSWYKNFKLSKKPLGGIETLICSFYFKSFQFEIVGQPLPVSQQTAYRHMIIEHNILSTREHEFKQSIIQLKTNGLKTEPAFAQLLGLKGDPYQALLTFAV